MFIKHCSISTVYSSNTITANTTHMDGKTDNHLEFHLTLFFVICFILLLLGHIFLEQ